MDIQIQNRALRFATLDGAFSSVMGATAGGIFLMGFALNVLNANSQQIGILAALPMFANLFQIFGSVVIEKTGKTKPLCLVSLIISRIVWIIIMMLPLAIFSTLSDFRVWVLVLAIGVSSLFGSVSGVAWLAWMSELVPESIRGSYFGKRNMIASSCGMVAVLISGKFLTFWQERFSQDNPYGFVIIFLVGLCAGIIALFFLSGVPEEKKLESQEKSSLHISTFLQPLKDKNFRILILFVSFWMFSLQLAAPFYGVFMIETLQISFTKITIFGAVATFGTLFMMKIWGPIADKLGNKPVIIVSTAILITVPFLWIFAIPKAYYIPVCLAHLVSGGFMAGASLSQFNILIKLSPQKGRSVYLALFAAITGLVGAIAPIVGGFILQLFSKVHYIFAGYQITNTHYIFLLSAFLQACTLFCIIRVKEPSVSTPVAVILQLKNDLNPQTGIAGMCDFMLVNVEKGENILQKVDTITDDLAQQSEETIKKVLDKGENFIKKPLDKLKKFLKDE